MLIILMIILINLSSSILNCSSLSLSSSNVSSTFFNSNLINYLIIDNNNNNNKTDMEISKPKIQYDNRQRRFIVNDAKNNGRSGGGGGQYQRRLQSPSSSMTTSTTTTTTSTTIINRCSPKTFETCLSMMQEVMENSSLAFPINSKDLDITCRKLKSGDYCAEKYIRSCAGNRQRHLYQDIVQGSKNVIRLLCQQGRTQQLYLQYAPCLKDISISSQKCLTVVRRFQSISKMMSENEQQQPQQPEPINRQKNDNDLRLLKFCCAYQESVDCQLQNVRKYCGQEGLRFFEHYMSEMTNSLINQHCAGYTYSDKCKRLRRRPHNHNHNNNHQHRGSSDHHQSHQKSNHHHPTPTTTTIESK
ncbi:hypothetical protein DERP_005067 [Dermatophagoides pteronyssinus]|uniref:Uncharacterized protein n=1 Tax=Dermatophagoides pteronyssinus TaxID=6956 RepID=A0ABQ8JTA0_DERPT|nr:hypothetical protein DERP_005067 [Dermatophagoides pteronyssinus]